MDNRSTMKLSEQKIIEKKSTILEAAQICFVRKGFHSTTMQDICRESDMSAGNIYRYFDSKEQIIEAFAQQELSWMTTAIQDLPSSTNMVEAIIDTIYWTASTLMQEGHAEMIAELYAEAGRNPRINAIYTKFSKQLIKEICDTLEVIEKTGVICPVHDHQTTAVFFISLVDGFVLHKIINSDFDLLKMRPAIATSIWALLGVSK